MSHSPQVEPRGRNYALNSRQITQKYIPPNPMLQVQTPVVASHDAKKNRFISYNFL